MGIFIFLPRIVMNNSTRNFSNSSNAQNSSSFKDKLRKLTTGVALAGTLLMGTACENKTNTTADQQKDKVENMEVKAEGNVTIANQKMYEDALAEFEFESIDAEIKADSIANLEEAKRIEVFAAENKQLAAENKQLAAENEKEREKIKQIRIETEKEFSTVTQEDIRKSKDLQKQLVEYIERCKKTGKHKPGKHVQSLMSSINR